MPPRNPFQSTAGNQQKKSSFGSFVTVNSRSLSASRTGPNVTTTKNIGDFRLPGRVWESKLTPDECCYHIFLQARGGFVIIFIEEENLPELAGVLRSLVSNVISITLKTQRAQAAKALSAAATQIPNSSTEKGGVIILSPQMAVFTESCLPAQMFIRSIVHVGNISPADFERRSLANRSVAGKGQGHKGGNSKTNPPEHIHVFPTGSIRLTGDIKRYDFNKSWSSVVQSRVAAARKLHFAGIEGKVLNQGKNDPDGSFADFEEPSAKKGDTTAESEQNQRKGIAGKIEALRNKLKILMNVPLPESKDEKRKTVDDKGKDKENEVKATTKKIENIGEKNTKIDSSATLREKMEILAMIVMPSKGGEVHKLAELGRSLAATRWMDSAISSAASSASASALSTSSLSSTSSSSSSGIGSSIGSGSSNVKGSQSVTGNAVCGECYPWGDVRYGASYDSESLKARDILNAFRDYVNSKAGGRVPKRLEEEKNVGKKLVKILKGCRIVGFGWRPHIRGDGEWGGAYGKCCGHNEVVMFYCRPFAPMEVLNTHVCSKVSPAPGNEGYDGCLEFLQAQCRWFKKNMTVWDDKYFHFIGSDGVDRPVSKNVLLSQSVPKLKIQMLNMRYLTVQSEGQIAPQILLDTIELFLSLASGSAIIDGLKCSLKVHRLICSYLLLGSSSSWAKASNRSATSVSSKK